MNWGAYASEILKFRNRIDIWRRNNKDKEIKIQFNLPPKTGAIYAVDDAIQEHILSVNEAGLEMLKATAFWGRKDVMTVSMLKIALEI